MAIKQNLFKLNLMVQTQAHHISDDLIDSYVLQVLIDDRNDALIDQHLACCQACQKRMEEARQFIQTLRQILHSRTALKSIP